jgi:plastocyanin
MPCRRTLSCLSRRAAFVLLAALVVATTSPATLARQDATPAAAAPVQQPPPNVAGLSIVASSLANPRGMDWDGSGALYVALAGIGGETAGVNSDTGNATNSNLGGPSASVVKIVAGCGVPVAEGLPSVYNGQSYKGIADVAFLGDDLYALTQVGGAASGNPGTTPGIVRIARDGATTKIFDFPAWLAKNPPAFKSGDFDPNGDSFVLVSDGRQLIYGDARTGLIIGVAPDGTAQKIADLSAGHPVPTGLAADRAGNLYAGYLTEAPYAPGGSRVDRIAPDGTVTTVWTGLTQLTGVAVGPDNTLYALEMSGGGGFPNGAGRLVRQTGPASSANVVTGLDLPVGLAIGPDGAFYISLPAIPAQPVEGAILRVDPAAPQPMQYAPGALTARPCSGAAALGVDAMDHAGVETGEEQAEAPGPISRVASDLADPRGMDWGDDGTFYVAQSGTGDSATSVGSAAGIVKIAGGCPVPVAESLPSSFDPYRDVLGTEDVLVMDGVVYALVATTGALDQMDPARPNGIYKAEPDGSVTLVADLTAWLNANPVKDPPGDRNSRGEPFRIVAHNDGFWIVDSNSGEVDRVELDGSVTRVADTSEQHLIITAMIPAPTGGVYLGTLTPSPHTDGTAKVLVVSADGAINDYWTGLTTVTGLAAAPDGSLWALEMATGNDTPEGMRPNTGRLVRQTGPDSLEVVVTGLDYPIDLAVGPDSALYVAGPAYGQNELDGWILRIDPAITPGAGAPADLMTDGPCASDPQAGADTSIAATPAAAPAATAAPAPAEATGNATALGGPGQTVAAEVPAGQDAFSPRTLTVVAGTTVTWTNYDEDPHTVTADDGSFTSQSVANGQSFSHTFDTPGTFAYHCEFHPDMTGTVVVVPAPAAATTPPPAATVTAAAAPAAAAAGASQPAAVSMKNYAFDPVTLTIAPGTTVTWTNDDTVPHTVTAADRSFDSGNMPPGATFSHTFMTAGTIDYLCQYHAGMKATIVVK